jgi:hypothetical protein
MAARKKGIELECPSCGAPSGRYGFELSGLQRWRCDGAVHHIWHTVVSSNLIDIIGEKDYHQFFVILGKLRRSDSGLLKSFARAVTILFKIAERTSSGPAGHWFVMMKAERFLRIFNSDSQLARATWELVKLTSAGLNYCRGPEVYKNTKTFDLRQYGGRTWEDALSQFLSSAPATPFVVISGVGRVLKTRDRLIQFGYVVAPFEIDNVQSYIALRRKTLGA